ncbi:MAG: hypothetical protein JNK20_13640 [Flavipsychrobacter sp.]|nr:hypothetical protein [Flavipsychrobacter sp.]
MANSKSKVTGLLKDLTPAELIVLKGQVAGQLNYTRGGKIPAAVKEVLTKLDPQTVEKLSELIGLSINIKKK